MAIYAKRHYESIASLIATMPERDIAVTMALRFAHMLQTDNPAFKYKLFIKACGCDEDARKRELEIAEMPWCEPCGSYHHKSARCI